MTSDTVEPIFLENTRADFVLHLRYASCHVIADSHLEMLVAVHLET